MDQLSNIRFSAWRDGTRTACQLVADVPGSKLGYISFYFTEDEFRSFTNGGQAFSDLAHHLHAYSESCTFFDLNFPNAQNGIAEIPFIKAEIPMFVRRVLLKWAERRWAEDSHMDRPVLKISSERAARWMRLYGQSKGTAKLEMSDETKNFLEECLSNDTTTDKYRTLRSRIDHLLTIARNGTWKFFEQGKVRLSKDFDGFYFQIISPRGKCTLNGGVINHGRDGETDWSIHT